MAEELLEEAPFLASHLYAHSVLCLLIRACPSQPATTALVRSILAGDIAGLCSHKRGCSVAMAILSSGVQQHQAQIVACLASQVQRFARHRCSSALILRALCLDGCWGRDTLISEFMHLPDRDIARLACHCFGVRIVQALLSLPMVSERIGAALGKDLRRLRRDRYASNLLGDQRTSTPCVLR